MTTNTLQKAPHASTKQSPEVFLRNFFDFSTLEDYHQSLRDLLTASPSSAGYADDDLRFFREQFCRLVQTLFELPPSDASVSWLTTRTKPEVSVPLHLTAQEIEQPHRVVQDLRQLLPRLLDAAYIMYLQREYGD